MALVDTSACIEFLRRTRSAVCERVSDLIASGEPIAITQPIVMELLIGVRSAAAEAELRRFIEGFDLLAVDADIDFEEAADIARHCRTRGSTVPPIDCMIASVAMRNEVAILSSDRDFSRIASLFPLMLDPATPR